MVEDGSGSGASREMKRKNSGSGASRETKRKNSKNSKITID